MQTDDYVLPSERPPSLMASSGVEKFAINDERLIGGKIDMCASNGTIVGTMDAPRFRF